MPRTADGSSKILALARRAQGVTARAVVASGIHRQVLTRLVESGKLQRVARGNYRVPGHRISEQHALVLAANAVPRGVVTLLSALQLHGIGTQQPSQVWVAIDRRAKRPTLQYPSLRVVRYTGRALTEGVEQRKIEGNTVRVYNLAKTIADCFKYRNKIGLDVALEALREAWRSRRISMAELDRYAEICRVQRVLSPYIETLVA